MKKSILISLFAVFFGATVYAQPANDNCVNAQTLTVGAPCANGTNAAATVQPGEPTAAGCWGGVANRTVWYKFTTGVAGTYTISTDNGGTTDTQLKLYSGTCAAPVLVGCNDDGGATNAFSAVLSANGLAASTTYLIQIDVFGTGVGAFCINVVFNPPIPNDCIANAIDITSQINSINPTILPFSCNPFDYVNAGSTPTHDAIPGDNNTTGAGNCHLGAANGSDINDIWFKFIVDASTPPSIWLDSYPFEPNNTAYYSAALYSGATPTGTCGAAITGLTYVDCSAGGGNIGISIPPDPTKDILGGPRDVSACTLFRPRINISSLPFGTYYYRVWEQFGDIPLGSVNVCVELGAPQQPISDPCPAASPLPATIVQGCGDMPNWNIDYTALNQSNSGCYGNACNAKTNEPQLAASAAGDAQENCVGGYVTILGYANNVINNTAIYSFDVDACSSCNATMLLTFDNLSYGGVRDNVIQVQVMEAQCVGAANSIIAYAGNPSCLVLRPTGNAPLKSGTRYYIMVDGQDGQLIKYDINLKVTYSGGVGPTACVASQKPVGRVVPDKLIACPGETVSLASTGSTSGMVGNAAQFCNVLTYFWGIDGGTLTAGALNGPGPLQVNWTNTTQNTITKTVKFVIINNGCPSDTVYQNIDIKPRPNALFTVKTPVCLGALVDDAVTYTGFARVNATYTWNFGLNGTATPGGTLQGPHDVTWTTAGNKTITLSVTQDGCTTQTPEQRTIVVSDAPTSTFTISKDPMCLGDEVTVSYTGNGVSADDYTAWSFLNDNDVIVTQFPVSPNFKDYKLKWKTIGNKSISLSVKNTANCTGPLTTRTNIVVKDIPDLSSTSATQTTGCGQAGGSATVNPAPAGAYNYLWNDPAAQITQTATNLLAGTYRVTVTDNVAQCSNSTTVSINDLNGPTSPAPTVTNALCAGGNTGTATITLNNVNSATTYTITIKDQAGVVVAPTPAVFTSPSYVKNNLVKGNYTYEILGADNCKAPGSFSINEPSRLLANAGADKQICPGDSVSLAGSALNGTTPYKTYSWNNGVGEGQTVNVTPTATTTYQLTVRDANDCPATDDVIVSIKPVATGTVDIDKTVLCDQETTDLTYIGDGTLADQYQWDFDGGIGSIGATDMGPQTIYWTTAGKKKVTLTVTKNGCPVAIGQDSVVVTPPPVAALTITPDLSDVCVGKTKIIEFTGTASTSAVFTWMFGKDSISVDTLVPNRKYEVTWSTPGSKTISVQVREGAACISLPASTSINVLDVPAAPGVSNLDLCRGAASSPLTASGSTGSFLWYTAATGGTGASTAPTPSTATVGVQTFYVSQITPAGCESVRSKLDVRIKPVPVADFNYGNLCKGSPNIFPTGVFTKNGDMIVGSTVAAVGSFTATNNLIFANGITGEIDLTNSTAGTYRITYTVSVDGCSKDTSVTKTLRALPLTGFKYDSLTYCLGEPNALAKLEPSVPTTGTFKAVPEPGLVFKTGTPKGTIDLFASVAGKYKVTHTVTTNGCTDSTFKNVTLFETPVAAFAMPIATCQGTPVVITAGSKFISSAPVSYTWNFNGGTASPANSTNYRSTYNVSWNDAPSRKAVSYTIKNADCSSKPNIQFVDVVQKPTASLVSSLDIPAVTLSEPREIVFVADPQSSVPNTFKYEWDMGDVNDPVVLPNSFTVAHTFKNEGVFEVRVRVSTADNCFDEASTNITVLDNPNLLVPDAFSPNGDEENDFFRPLPLEMRITYFEVFNRWGERVFSDINNSDGWNGFYKSEKVPEGVYVYFVKGVTAKGVPIEKKGLVTVTR